MSTSERRGGATPDPSGGSRADAPASATPDSDPPVAPDPDLGGRALARNTLLNVAGQTAPLLLAVLAIPYLLDGLGADRFGVLAIAWMVLGYFTVLGFGRATTKFVAEILGSGDHRRLPTVTWDTVAIQAVFGVAGTALFAAATPLIAERLLQMPAPLVAESRTAFYILAASVPLVMIGSAFRGVLEAAQRFDLVNAIRAPSIAATFLLPVLGLALGWNLPGIVALLVAGKFATMLVYYAFAIRAVPTLGGVPRFDTSELRPLISFGSWVTVSGVVSPALYYLDRFILGSLVSVAAVGYYAAPFEVVSRLRILPASLVEALFPAFSTLAGRGDDARVRRLTTRSVNFVLFSLGPIAVLLIAGAGDLLELWLGGEVAARSTLAMQILAVGVLINSLAYVPYSMLQGLGRPDIPAKFQLLELPLHVLLAVILVREWGIPGAALAWTVRVAIDAALLFAAAGRLSTRSYAGLLSRRVLKTTLVLAAFAVPAAWSAASLPSFGVRLIALIGFAALLALTIWRFSLEEIDRTQILAMVGMAR